MMMNMSTGGNKRVGDWKCYGCGNNNYANREQCNKCGIPRANFIAKSGLRAGDWICPACQNHNFADKVACNKCGSPKGNTEGSTFKMKPGDWLCPQCSNHNYADKVTCNRCGGPKGDSGRVMPSSAPLSVPPNRWG